MKKYTFILALIFSVCLGNIAMAQEGVSKGELLKALNNVDELGLSKEKSSELKNFNKGFADDVFSITDSDKSNDKKILELKNLRDKGSKDLKNILGEDSFKSFKKSVKKELKPLKRKTKLFKFIL
ncbi:hypothetical protein ACFQ5N_00960 [Lutibacter holmesii]|uniref:Uncharacterized protein n=1 Tax=Lutibacter holmesii TaxID=1137985 RepID=A0ABW3WJB4_9FLAO